jgi:hypothetical protein
MAAHAIEIGIVLARKPLKGPWATHTWMPLAALPAAPDLPRWTRLPSEDGVEAYYAGSAVADVHLRATGHYRDNLAAASPSIWVVLRPVGEEVELVSITIDPYEGEALVENFGDIVEAVAMPAEIRAEVQAFIDAFHVEQQFFKRKRDRADPDSLGRRGRASAPREDKAREDKE